ncbi:MAG TPA: hypothetical protein PKK26_09005 [Candidatus Wallbacteria bacterium]|nr:hypothetical protein [Candidatus Wallbacteria bacterium]
MLKNIDELIKDINAGKKFFIAGDEQLLKKLPRGSWIAGTIPYFMDAAGGVITREKVFALEVPSCAGTVKVSSYDERSLSSIPADSPENGFSLVIVPALSGVHVSYAQNAPDFPGLFMKNILGWISGVHLEDLGKVSPKVFCGSTGEVFDNKAVAMHCSLPKDKTAVIGIINLFEQGAGDTITFDKTGFSANDCMINGKKQNFSEYLLKNKIDTRLPLVADYCGSMVNVSFQSVDKDKRMVNFYAPVFTEVEYKIAKPVADYVSAFTKAISGLQTTSAFSCNCILNFLYSELEGKKTPGMTGPITFGEIAYQLLNQTLVYLEIRDAK